MSRFHSGRTSLEHLRQLRDQTRRNLEHEPATRRRSRRSRDARATEMRRAVRLVGRTARASVRPESLNFPRRIGPSWLRMQSGMRPCGRLADPCARASGHPALGHRSPVTTFVERASRRRRSRGSSPAASFGMRRATEAVARSVAPARRGQSIDGKKEYGNSIAMIRSERPGDATGGAPRPLRLTSGNSR